MALDQLRDFLRKMESDPALKEEVLAKCTADDVARVALQFTCCYREKRDR